MDFRCIDIALMSVVVLYWDLVASGCRKLITGRWSRATSLCRYVCHVHDTQSRQCRIIHI